MDKYIGKVLADRYEILELIGIGGMAYVYRAMDKQEDRVVAVKILKDEFLANEEFIRRFRNESRAIALLNHPNIVKIYDVLFGEFIQMIVMEYIDGITLKEYIDHQKVLKWKEVVHFTVQILRALQHAHDKGIVHRDIKPQNIMLLQDGTIKVMDFGIARFARSDPQTMTDKAIGSVHYISPEQARGERIDEKTDIYSVGVMLFEMLTGELPFQGESPVSVALKQIQDLPMKPRDINPNIPKGLEYIILHAMQKDPQKRYQSAAEMLRDLDAFKRNPEIEFAEERFVVDEPTRSFPAMAPSEGPEPEEPWEKKSAVVPVISGIAIAFIIAAILFVVGIVWINNPFEVVADFDMPKLVGMTVEDAQRQYTGLQIVVTKRDYSEEYEKDLIYEQNPREGRSVKINATVQVSVSDGKKEIELPDFVDQDAELAEKTIRDLGLVPIVSEEYNTEVTEGYVIRMYPEKHSILSPGDTVEIVVSVGKKDTYTKVPDITGITVSNAIRILESYGLKLGEQTAVASDLPVGYVVDQTPIKDQMVESGTTVDVSISSGDGSSSSSSSSEEEGEPVRLSLPVVLPEGGPSSYNIQVVDTQAQEVVANKTITPELYQELGGRLSIILIGSGTRQYTVLIDGYSYLTLEVYFSETKYAVIQGEQGVFDFTRR